MGRSGTSAVTRAFHESGYFVALPADMMNADESNPTGYFENWGVYDTNEKILERLGCSRWDVPSAEEQAALARAGDAPGTPIGTLKARLAQLLDTAGSAPLALKDPRIGMLMGLWWPVLENVLHPVLVVRHPVEVALSLQRREGTAIPVGIATWQLNLQATLRELDGRWVTVIPYARVLEDGRLVSELVESVSAKLEPRLRAGIDPARARGALDRDIRRGWVPPDEGERWLDPAQARLWGFLDSLGAGEVRLRAPALDGSDELARELTRYEQHRQHERWTMGARIEQAGRDLEERDERLRTLDAELVCRAAELERAQRRVEELERMLAGPARAPTEPLVTLLGELRRIRGNRPGGVARALKRSRRGAAAREESPTR